MKRFNFFIVLSLVVFLTSCSRQKQDNEMTAELEKVSDETVTTPVANQEPSSANENSIQPLTEGAATFPVQNSSAASTMPSQNLANDFQKTVNNSGPFQNPTIDRVQTALKNAGFYTGKIDGNLGPQTKRAIRNFQTKNKLSADGKIGPKTWQKLEPYLNSTTQ